MTKRNQDIPSHPQGDTLTIDADIVDEDGTALDLTGYQAIRWVLAEQYGGGDPLVEKTAAGGGITVVSAPNGEVRVAVEPADTDAVSPGQYRHELEVTDDNGDVSTVLVGTVEILRSDS